MKGTLLLLLVGLICFSPFAMAQKKTVTGTVASAEDNTALAGVTVRIKETGVGTTTDDKGAYSIDALAGQTLVFTYIGYQSVERTIAESNTISVNLSSENPLDEVVVVGYGTQQRATVTGSVSTVDVEKTLQTRPITDVARALQGAVPGLTITTPSGDLGTNPTIRLRGVTGSLNTGNTGAAPLILVDNVEIPSLNMINPNDIESISVLKDASASIYGTRAAWGVILITTKSGSRNTPSMITYSNNLAWQTPTKTAEIASGPDGARTYLEAQRRVNPSFPGGGIVGIRYDDYALEKMEEWDRLYGGQNLSREMVEGRDWEIRDGMLYFHRSFDAPAMFMRETTPQQNHNLSVTGGSERVNYNLGLGYMNESGVLNFNPDEFNRYNLNVGVDATVNNWLDAYTKVLYSYTDVNRPFSYNGDTYDPWFYLFRWPRNFPYGTIDGIGLRNSITEVEQAQMTTMKNNMARLTVGGRAKIAPGLTLDGDYTYTNQSYRFHETGGVVSGWDFWAGGQMINRPFTSAAYDRVAFTNSFQDRHVGNLFATFNQSLSSHNLKLTAGVNAELYNFSSATSRRTELMDPEMGQLPLATGEQTVAGGASHWSTLGFFGRINYDYQNKYIVEVMGRYDGSSRFPSHDRWGFFPSISAGYVLSEEGFMDFADPYLNFLKVRGSFGSVGNQNVGNNRFLSIMNPASSGWLVNNAFMNTLTTPTPLSPTLTWEKVSTREIGVDAALFNNRLNFTFNRFRRTVSDMISPGVVLPASFGAASPVRNFGEMQTNGWEIELGFNHTFATGFYMGLTGQLSDFKETITEYSGAAIVNANGTSSNYKGKTIGEIWGYETDRFFTKDDFQQDANGNLITTDDGRYILMPGIASQSFYEASWFFYGPGDIKYRDLNGDGEINTGSGTVEDPGDRRIIGNSTPRYQYGFRTDFAYKGFDLGVFLQGVGKREVWANGDMFIPGFRPGEAWYIHQMDYWTPDNPGAFYPRPTDQGQSNASRNFLPQTRYLLDMSYLRVKNLTLGYTFPASWLEKAKVKNLRIFFSGENLFEFDNVDLPIDPEVDYTLLGLNDGNSFGRVYPYRRTYSFGLQVSL